MSLIALESCRTFKDINLVILDEPLAHLDKSNINYQLQTIQKIQELSNPPSVLIISHHFIEEMRNKLQNFQELSLFSKKIKEQISLSEVFAAQ
jgi:ABC-type molybdenum transport system ATPase subunit/photorepair protein PhrA